VTAERWEAREATRPGNIRLGTIANMEILPGGRFMGRKAQSWTSADTLESGLPRSFGIKIGI
jgi:hypothetical protein